MQHAISLNERAWDWSKQFERDTILLIERETTTSRHWNNDVTKLQASWIDRCLANLSGRIIRPKEELVYFDLVGWFFLSSSIFFSLLSSLLLFSHHWLSLSYLIDVSSFILVLLSESVRPSIIANVQSSSITPFCQAILDNMSNSKLVFDEVRRVVAFWITYLTRCFRWPDRLADERRFTPQARWWWFG